MIIKYLFLFSSILIFMNISCSTQKEVVAFKIYSQEDKKIMKVNRSGAVNVSGKKMGILRPDGVLTNLENDTLAYQGANGVVYSREQEALGKIDKNGAIEIDPNNKFSWTADGKLQLKRNQSMRVEPNFKDYYDKASFLFIVYAAMASSGEASDVQIEDAKYE